MEGLLDANHYKVAELIDQLTNNAAIAGDLQFISELKPLFYTHKGKFIYEYGEIIGEGETAYLAMTNFVSKFKAQKVKE